MLADGWLPAAFLAGAHRVPGEDEARQRQREQTEHAERGDQGDAASGLGDIAEHRQAHCHQDHHHPEPLQPLGPAEQERLAQLTPLAVGFVLFGHVCILGDFPFFSLGSVEVLRERKKRGEQIRRMAPHVKNQEKSRRLHPTQWWGGNRLFFLISRGQEPQFWEKPSVTTW
ncbi:hypothetical protein FQZ97_1075440 [compost metagenome]